MHDTVKTERGHSYRKSGICNSKEEMETAKRDKGKGKMKQVNVPELPFEIWNRVFRHYYDMCENDWLSKGTYNDCLTPILISPYLYDFALAALYEHPHLTYSTIGCFLKNVCLKDQSSSRPRTQLVRNLTVRPSPQGRTYVESDHKVTPPSIHEALPDLFQLFPDLNSLTLKDALVYSGSDAQLLFMALSATRPIKARLEIGTSDLHASPFGSDILAAVATDVYQRIPMLAMASTQTKQDLLPSTVARVPTVGEATAQEAWREALFTGTYVDLPWQWFESPPELSPRLLFPPQAPVMQLHLARRARGNFALPIITSNLSFGGMARQDLLTDLDRGTDVDLYRIHRSSDDNGSHRLAASTLPSSSYEATHPDPPESLSRGRSYDDLTPLRIGELPVPHAFRDLPTTDWDHDTKDDAYRDEYTENTAPSAEPPPIIAGPSAEARENSSSPEPQYRNQSATRPFLPLIFGADLIGPRLAHYMRMRLLTIMLHWMPRLLAFSFVALDPAASIVIRAPKLNFWTQIAVRHIRVRLPRGLCALDLLKGTKIPDENRGHQAHHSPPLQVVGGDCDGRDLLHNDTRLFEIEVNTATELDDKAWLLCESRLPAQVCRILAGESDWRHVCAEFTPQSPPEIHDFISPPSSPSTSEFLSPTFSNESWGAEDNEEWPDSDGVQTSTYNADAAAEQQRRIEDKKRERGEL